MSSKVTIHPSKGVRGVGLLSIIAGILLIVVGAVAYWQVAVQLRAENITVSEDADFFAGARVQDPFTAFSQAAVINKHALASSEGKTYAELAKDDPLRAVVMNASFLRASLFTSVVAFGVAALVAGLGVLFAALGWALRRLAGGPSVVVESFDGPTPRHGQISDADASSSIAADAPASPPSGVDPVPATAVVDSAEVAVPDAADATASEPALVRRRSSVSRANASTVSAPADGSATGGAAVAETLSRHSQAEPTPVSAPLPAVLPLQPLGETWTDSAPAAESADPVPVEQSGTVPAAPTADVVAEPAATDGPPLAGIADGTLPDADVDAAAGWPAAPAPVAEESIPVPPNAAQSQGWESPAERNEGN